MPKSRVDLQRRIGVPNGFQRHRVAHGYVRVVRALQHQHGQLQLPSRLEQRWQGATRCVNAEETRKARVQNAPEDLRDQFRLEFQ